MLFRHWYQDPIINADDSQSDERYFVKDGRRWRRTDPAIPESLRQQLVNELMAARRAVKSALAADDEVALAIARARVQDAKVALGERGRAWWLPHEDAALRERIGSAIRSLLRNRAEGATICPSEAARIAGGEQWRKWMTITREVAAELVREGWLETTRSGNVVDPDIRGPIRLRQRTKRD